MSFFRTMFQGDPKAVKTWLIQVNIHGEAVVYRLDAEGRPTDFAAGELGQVLGPPIREASPRLFLARQNPCWHSDSPYSWGFDDGNNWAQVAATLDGKSCAARTRVLTTWRTLLRLNLPIEEYIQFHHHRGSRVGPKGLAYDAEYWPADPDRTEAEAG